MEGEEKEGKGRREEKERVKGRIAPKPQLVVWADPPIRDASCSSSPVVAVCLQNVSTHPLRANVSTSFSLLTLL